MEPLSCNLKQTAELQFRAWKLDQSFTPFPWIILDTTYTVGKDEFNQIKSNYFQPDSSDWEEIPDRPARPLCLIDCKPSSFLSPVILHTPHTRELFLVVTALHCAACFRSPHLDAQNITHQLNSKSDLQL